jgi:hypothetical protein
MQSELSGRVARLVGSDKDVLGVLCTWRGLLEPLVDHWCRVVAIEAVNLVEIEREVRDRRFDSLVIDLGCAPDPRGALTTLRRYLRDEGYVVAVAPNATFAPIALALLAGDNPDCPSARVEPRLRRYTWTNLQHLFDELELCVGTVERHTQLPIAADVLGKSDLEPRPELVAALQQDFDAQTEEFVVRAHLLATPGMRWVQSRLRELVDANAAANREIARLGGSIEALHAVARTAIEREADQRQLLIDLNEQLLSRDVEFTSSEALVRERTAWAQSLENELTERNALVRELHATVLERTDWAQTLDHELTERNALVRELQATVHERTEWALQLGQELAARESLAAASQALVRAVLLRLPLPWRRRDTREA